MKGEFVGQCRAEEGRRLLTGDWTRIDSWAEWKAAHGAGVMHEKARIRSLLQAQLLPKHSVKHRVKGGSAVQTQKQFSAPQMRKKGKRVAENPATVLAQPPRTDKKPT